MLNPDPIAWLVGRSNEAKVMIGGREANTLVDLAAQVPSTATKFCRKMELKIKPLTQILKPEEMGIAAIQYDGYVEVNLKILGIKRCNVDIVFSSIPTTSYGEEVPHYYGYKCY